MRALAAGGDDADAVEGGAALDRIPLASASLHFVRISHKTCWTFLRLAADDGRTGAGEATLQGREEALLGAADRLVPLALAEATASDPGTFARRHAPGNLHEAAIVSALDQALWGLHAQAAGQSLSQALGQTGPGMAVRRSVPVYANINRRTERRTPEGFAASAETARAAGHVAFKLAPFDEVNHRVCAEGDGVRAMGKGIERVAAVREAVGGHARLMVDCHWRFDEATARKLGEALARLDVYWIETPMTETPANIPALARLRRHCNALGVLQAGLETSIGWDGFRPFCEAGVYDVVMPDVKYMGGVEQVLQTAAACARLGIDVSPHNPSGPVCHAASLQVCAAIAALDMLETQFDESPLFDELVAAPFPPTHDGHQAPPAGAGLGVALAESALQAHAERPARHWRA